MGRAVGDCGVCGVPGRGTAALAKAGDAPTVC